MAILAWQNVLGQMQHALANALAQPLDQDIQKYTNFLYEKEKKYEHIRNKNTRTIYFTIQFNT